MANRVFLASATFNKTLITEENKVREKEKEREREKHASHGAMKNNYATLFPGREGGK